MQDHGVNISADNVALSGFTIQNAGYENYSDISGVYISSDFVFITENIITKNPIGLYLEKVDYNNISNNIVTKNYVGTLLSGCNNSIIWNNIISENTRNGIHFDLTYNTIFSRNTITKNEDGMTTTGSGWFGFDNTISYNNISDNEIYGLELHGAITSITNNNFMNNGRNAIFGYMVWEFWFIEGFTSFNGANITRGM